MCIRDRERVMDKKLPGGWQDLLPVFSTGKKIATREASGKVLEALAPAVPELIGGSADLAPSNKTYIKGYESVRKGDFSGRNIHFGVREHGMGCLLYTSDAADDLLCVDLGGRRIIKKKTKTAKAIKTE